MKIISSAALLILLMSLFDVNAQTQDTTKTDSIRKDAINLFIDCNYCDISYIKKHIKFVNYVRDTKEAHVHLMVTANQTGSGGIEYGLFFIGQNTYKGINDTLKLTMTPNSTSDEVRTAMTKTIKIGLIRYVSKTPLINYINIDYDHPESESAPIKDKWNSWVFSLSSSGNYNSQSSSSSFYLSSSVSASRTTEASKVSFSAGNNFNEQRFKMDNEEIIGINRSNYFSHLYAKSLSQHWSIGEYANASTSTYSNLNYAFSIKPAIEYNIFPYSQYNRRKLCFNYSIGVNHHNYIDTTIYFKTKETYGSQNLSVYYQTIQKWGNIYISLDGSTFLNDFKKNSINIYSSIEWRIFKGFSINYSMSYGFVRDQIGLPKGEASRDDVLLSLKQLQTDYTMYAYFGLSYTFGSIYNNVVNPRF
jgi:hypothetical protein